METKTKHQARFDTRLSRTQKQFFEKAAALGGYRNLTDFILSSAQEKAKEIVQEHEQIITSEQDARIFFEAITNPQAPNEQLSNAYEVYKAQSGL